MRTLIIAICLLSGVPCPEGLAVPERVSAVIGDKKPKKNVETVTFKTTMHCKNCVKKITENISFTKGVEDLKVTLDDKKVTIKYDASKTSEEALAQAIRKLGYEVEKVAPKP